MSFASCADFQSQFFGIEEQWKRLQKAAVEMSLLSMCPSSCTLQRGTKGKDAGGGNVITWANVSGAVDVRCDVQPAGSHVAARYMQGGLFVSHSIYLSSDVQAKSTDRFIVGSRIFLLKGYRRPDPGRLSWPAVADVEEEVTAS